MDRAVIFEGSRLAEHVAEGRPLVAPAGIEAAVIGRHAVLRPRVLPDPLHGFAHFDRYALGVVSGNRVGISHELHSLRRVGAAAAATAGSASARIRTLAASCQRY